MSNSGVHLARIIKEKELLSLREEELLELWERGDWYVAPNKSKVALFVDGKEFVKHHMPDFYNKYRLILE